MTAPGQVAVRAARADDLPLLPALERSGDVLFRARGMHLVADADPPPPEVHAPACGAGRLWVAETVGGVSELVGFARVELVDGLPHVEQLSVAPAAQGRRLGARLLAAAADWARAHGHARMTLRTFTDVPWNGPYYAQLGWRPLAPEQEGPELAALGRHEADLGLTQWPRQAMVLDL